MPSIQREVKDLPAESQALLFTVLISLPKAHVLDALGEADIDTDDFHAALSEAGDPDLIPYSTEDLQSY